jgi:DNA invertase Pin-like site-specific DNA recombinase
MANGKYIAYYRVSTQKQGVSGLGLEDQQAAVRSHLNGGDWQIIAEVTEIESGTKSDRKRPKLAEALRLCRIHNATLIIAKLDRLARNVAFVSNLMESNVEFVAVDFPTANRLTVHILAAVAEHEAKCISQRTSAAMQAAKARGRRFGGLREGGLPHSARQAGAAAGRAARAAKATAHASDLAVVINHLRDAGITSNTGLAKALTEKGIPTHTGKAAWQATQVQRVLSRLS